MRGPLRPVNFAGPAAMSGSAPPLYRLTRAFVRAGVRLFYRRIVTHTLEHVPPRGPVVFAATHPNSVTDPLVLGALKTLQPAAMPSLP